ncbi:MAG: type IV pilus biogenesis/stability protein PilW [Ketobacteraceae bacterium]|nr:type IV pilus biogenesis/stability protein PilW [Ketobacteraceae bacterium]
MTIQSTLKRCFLTVTATILLSACVTVEGPSSLKRNKDPDKAVELYTKLGVKYLQKRDMENASRTLQRAYEIDPDSPLVNNALALFYTVENEPEQVVKHYEAALEEDPGFSVARNNYAAYLYEQGRYQDAIRQLEVAVKDFQYGRRFQSYENLGLCYLELGNKEAAEKAFKRALELNPRLPRSLINMADLSFQQGDYQAAATYLMQLDRLGVKPSARKLWLEIQISRMRGDKNKLASLALALKNLFPMSPEYKAYLELIENETNMATP